MVFESSFVQFVQVFFESFVQFVQFPLPPMTGESFFDPAELNASPVPHHKAAPRAAIFTPRTYRAARRSGKSSAHTVREVAGCKIRAPRRATSYG